MFDRATVFVINRGNARRSRRTIGGICSVHSEYCSAVPGGQLWIDVNDFRLSSVRFIRVRLSDSLFSLFIRHNHLEEPSRGVELTNSRNRHGSGLLATNDR